MSNELKPQEAALAWAQGKMVDAANKSDPENWKRVNRVGVDNPDNRTFYAGVFNRSDLYRFRLAPEPPTKRYRPWTADEVPVGVKMREKECEGWFTPACGGGGEIEAVVDGEISKVKLTDLALHHEFSEDNGKTWKPCGVEVES